MILFLEYFASSLLQPQVMQRNLVLQGAAEQVLYTEM